MERLQKNIVDYMQRKQLEFAKECLREIKLLVSEEHNSELCLDDTTKYRIYAVIFEPYDGTTKEYFINHIELDENNVLQLTTDEGWSTSEEEVCYTDSVWPQMLSMLYQYIKTK